MYKTICIIAIFLIICPLTYINAQSNLTVEIVTLESNKGFVIVDLMDKNEELDTNFIGIPKEGFGFSNDAIGKFGPKDFSEWLFEVSGDTLIKMTTKYMF